MRVESRRLLRNRRKPEDWENDMTLCIAAIAQKRGTTDEWIIAVSDMMLSAGDLSTSTEPDTAKIIRLTDTGRWLMMYAGSPSTALAISGGVQIPATELRNEIIQAFEASYQRELEKAIECEVLAPYGLSRKEFLEKGRSVFGDEEFQRLLYQVASVRLDIDVLLAGFEPNGGAHLMSLSQGFTRQLHNCVGFHAIGNGSSLANAHLMGTYDAYGSNVAALYRVAEAKFKSEAAPGVGRKTAIVRVAPNGAWTVMNFDEVEALKAVWKECAFPPVPEKAAPIIRARF